MKKEIGSKVNFITHTQSYLNQKDLRACPEVFAAHRLAIISSYLMDYTALNYGPDTLFREMMKMLH